MCVPTLVTVVEALSNFKLPNFQAERAKMGENCNDEKIGEKKGKINSSQRIAFKFMGGFSVPLVEDRQVTT
jgi:hypothetical protein